MKPTGQLAEIRILWSDGPMHIDDDVLLPPTKQPFQHVYGKQRVKQVVLVQLEMCIKSRFIFIAQKHGDERSVWHSFDVKPSSETLLVQTFSVLLLCHF